VGTQGRILTSTDGVLWNTRTSGVTDWLVGVAYGFNRFVAVGDNGRILTSSDGQAWKTIPNVPTTARLNNVYYGFSGPNLSREGLWVAVGEGGTALVSSDNGETWRAGNTGVNGWLRGLTHMVTRSYLHAPVGGGTAGLSSIRGVGENAFLATGQGGMIIASVDGIAWTRLNSGTTEDLEAVTGTYSSGVYQVYGPGHAIAIGSNGAIRAYDAPHASYFGNILQPYFGPTPLPAYSSWTTGTLGVTSDVRLRGLARNSNVIDYRTPILLASGERGVVLIEGQQEDAGVTENLVASVYHNNKFYIVGENEIILQQAGSSFLSRLGNLATRGAAGGNRGALIGGLVIGGGEAKRMLLRAVGPGLNGFAVPGSMPQPILTAFDFTGRSISSSAGWADAPEIAAAARSVGAFALQPGSRDAAVVTTLQPGSYTVDIQPSAGTPAGVALFEAYDLDASSNSGARLVNLSTRGYVGGETEPLIGGLVITGASRGNVLIRGIGPTLRSFGVMDAVTDCVIAVYRGTQVLASNDDWGTNDNSSQLSFTFVQVGAFELAGDSKDSALLLSGLAPGAYTVQLTARNANTGTGLIEIYELP
jgi:hypothetical protein